VTVLRLGVLGWLAGFVAYLAALGILYGQEISRGDLRFVVVITIVVFAVCYLLIYLPVLGGVRKLLPEPRARWVFPLVAVLIGLVPTAAIARFYGGSFRALMTPESLMFGIMFIAIGLVVGAGFPHLKAGREAPDR